MLKTLLIAAGSLLCAVPAVAQTAPAAKIADSGAPSPTPVDPARLAAAQALVDTLFPPATCEQMIRGMLAPMMASAKKSLLSDYPISATTRDPRARKIIDDHFAKALAYNQQALVTAVPQMTSALARSFARRLDVAQMDKARAFFSSPVGRQYRHAAVTITSDPDFAVWQRSLMDKVARRSMQDTKTLTAELMALSSKSTSQ